MTKKSESANFIVEKFCCHCAGSLKTQQMPEHAGEVFFLQLIVLLTVELFLLTVH